MSGAPEDKGGADRRIHPRSPIVVREARCISGMEVFFGYALNISRGGLFISTPKLRTPGEIHEIEFRLPSAERAFRCRAKVVWARPYRHGSRLTPGFGLQFLDLPEEEAGILDEWVRSSAEA